MLMEVSGGAGPPPTHTRRNFRYSDLAGVDVDHKTGETATETLAL